jgi:hypothetical protein
MKKPLLLGLAALLLLPSCSSRGEADQKMARGCEAGINALFKKKEPGTKISKIVKTSFASEKYDRIVTLETLTQAGENGDDNPETFTCRFNENYSVGFIGWNAEIQKISFREKVFGKDASGNLQGGLSEYLELVRAINKAM